MWAVAAALALSGETCRTGDHWQGLRSRPTLPPTRLQTDLRQLGPGARTVACARACLPTKQRGRPCRGGSRLARGAVRPAAAVPTSSRQGRFVQRRVPQPGRELLRVEAAPLRFTICLCKQQLEKGCTLHREPSRSQSLLGRRTMSHLYPPPPQPTRPSPSLHPHPPTHPHPTHHHHTHSHPHSRTPRSWTATAWSSPTCWPSTPGSPPTTLWASASTRPCATSRCPARTARVSRRQRMQPACWPSLVQGE